MASVISLYSSTEEIYVGFSLIPELTLLRPSINLDTMYILAEQIFHMVKLYLQFLAPW